jgi:hypothetical protein
VEGLQNIPISGDTRGTRPAQNQFRTHESSSVLLIGLLREYFACLNRLPPNHAANEKVATKASHPTWIHMSRQQPVKHAVIASLVLSILLVAGAAACGSRFPHDSSASTQSVREPALRPAKSESTAVKQRDPLRQALERLSEHERNCSTRAARDKPSRAASMAGRQWRAPLAMTSC